MPPHPSSNAVPLVVFTDLDGTLLDARTYSATPARAALALLEARGAAIVFCSSKTAAEQRTIRRELGLGRTPLIVENGSAVVVPEAAGLPVAEWPAPDGTDERVRVLGRSSAEVRRGIARAADCLGLRVTGYSDLSGHRVAELTGLEPAAADRARQRDYSETLVDDFNLEIWAALDSALLAEGLQCRPGGRFRTVTGAIADKGRAVHLVTELYSAAAGRRVITAGLGDSANDESLLAAVDHPYLLAKHDGTWEPLNLPRLRRIACPGPHGWHAAILELLALV